MSCPPYRVNSSSGRDAHPSGGRAVAPRRETSRAEGDLGLVWRSYVRRFDPEYAFRFLKQGLRRTTPRVRHPEQADRWTGPVVAAYAQLRLARARVADLRLPRERRYDAGRLMPVRVYRVVSSLSMHLGTPARHRNPAGGLPGRSKGSLRPSETLPGPQEERLSRRKPRTRGFCDGDEVSRWRQSPPRNPPCPLLRVLTEARLRAQNGPFLALSGVAMSTLRDVGYRAQELFAGGAIPLARTTRERNCIMKRGPEKAGLTSWAHVPPSRRLFPNTYRDKALLAASVRTHTPLLALHAPLAAGRRSQTHDRSARSEAETGYDRPRWPTREVGASRC